jgi:predicted nucleotidyltransferase
VRNRLPELEAVYVFGSAAAGTALPESDLDLAVLAAAPIEPGERFELAGDLARVVGREVDLVDLRSASDVLRVQAIAHGSRLFARNPSAADAFEAYALSSYARLNEERHAILEQIQRDGTIHGR